MGEVSFVERKSQIITYLLISWKHLQSYFFNNTPIDSFHRHVSLLPWKEHYLIPSIIHNEM